MNNTAGDKDIKLPEGSIGLFMIINTGLLFKFPKEAVSIAECSGPTS